MDSLDYESEEIVQIDRNGHKVDTGTHILNNYYAFIIGQFGPKLSQIFGGPSGRTTQFRGLFVSIFFS